MFFLIEKRKPNAWRTLYVLFDCVACSAHIRMRMKKKRKPRQQRRRRSTSSAVQQLSIEKKKKMKKEKRRRKRRPREQMWLEYEWMCAWKFQNKIRTREKEKKTHTVKIGYWWKNKSVFCWWLSEETSNDEKQIEKKKKQMCDRRLFTGRPSNIPYWMFSKNEKLLRIRRSTDGNTSAVHERRRRREKGRKCTRKEKKSVYQIISYEHAPMMIELYLFQ